MENWVTRLDDRSVAVDSLACVGLDPDPALMPVSGVFEFNRAIIDATHDLVCAYKPQLAFYEALGIEGLEALQKTVGHIRRVAPDVIIVGDAKRGDIGSTATAYARAMFEFWDFDVVTIHPYLGGDSVAPFLEYEGRGALVVCRTSNPGARELQDLRLDMGSETLGMTVYERVADAVEEWNGPGTLGLVVGATYPEEMTALRRDHPSLPFLIPGVGRQGGDVHGATRAGANADGRGIMVSSSRGVLYASSDPDGYADAARNEVEKLRSEINAALQELSGV
ncbi:MAG: orotidine-5'-phosphate decarboxylase [Chloroflexi bacterium]|nr:orotidine-5'-phosphate decarboxylase [Chloroflexota bacterium]